MAIYNIHNPAPHWDNIKNTQPLMHDLLVNIGATIFESKSLIIVPPKSKRKHINDAIKKNFLIQSIDGVTFANQEILVEYLVQYATIKYALPTWDDIEGFSKAISIIQHHGAHLKLRKDLARGVFILLALKGKDILKHISKSAQMISRDNENNFIFCNLYPPFCDTLPYLKIDPQKTAKYIGPILDAVANDLAGGIIYNTIEYIGNKSYDKAISLYYALIKNPDSPVVAPAPNTLIALSKIEFNEANNLVSELIDLEKYILKRVGISSLGKYEYTNKENYQDN